MESNIVTSDRNRPLLDSDQAEVKPSKRGDHGRKGNKDTQFSQDILRQAATNGYEALHKLLSCAANYDLDSEANALLWATKNRHEALVKLLLDHRELDIKEKDVGTWIALLRTAFRALQSILELLYTDKVVTVSSVNSNAQSELLPAASHGREV